jgi:hypothetical protein
MLVKDKINYQTLKEVSPIRQHAFDAAEEPKSE